MGWVVARGGKKEKPTTTCESVVVSSKTDPPLLRVGFCLFETHTHTHTHAFGLSGLNEMKKKYLPPLSITRAAAPHHPRRPRRSRRAPRHHPPARALCESPTRCRRCAAAGKRTRTPSLGWPLSPATVPRRPTRARRPGRQTHRPRPTRTPHHPHPSLPRAWPAARSPFG